MAYDPQRRDLWQYTGGTRLGKAPNFNERNLRLVRDTQERFREQLHRGNPYPLIPVS